MGCERAMPLNVGVAAIDHENRRLAPTHVANGTVMKVEFEDPLVRTHYNPKLKPGDTDANNLLAIQFMIPTNSSAPVDWNFCVEDIAAITAP